MTKQDWRTLAVLLSDRAAASTVPENRELLMSLSIVSTEFARQIPDLTEDEGCKDCGARWQNNGGGQTMAHATTCPHR